jgi:hypothetical protein
MTLPPRSKNPEVVLEHAGWEKKVSVIPGRREAANPESIATGHAGSAPTGVMDSGFLATLGPGMTD